MVEVLLEEGVAVEEEEDLVEVVEEDLGDSLLEECRHFEKLEVLEEAVSKLATSFKHVGFVAKFK